MSVDVAVTVQPAWRRKKTYLWLLAPLGLLHGLLYAYGLSHPPTQMGLELFIGFTLNVALLGWCYVDAEERKVAITGGLGFVMLIIAWIGVPWYFLRSRGFVGAAKAGFGVGLFALWFGGLFIGGIVATVVEAIAAR